MLHHNSHDRYQFFLQASKQMHAITKPLQEYFNIVYFDHVRIYQNGQCFYLCNHASWFALFLERAYALPGPKDYQQSGQYLWLGIDALHTYDEQLFVAQQNFKFGHGVSFIDQQQNYYDLYNFAGPADKPQMINFYLNQKEMLLSFVHFYKAKAHTLIRQADRSRIMLPLRNIPVEDYEKTRYESFLSRISDHRFYLEELSGVHLSEREMQCLKAYIHGYSAKQIARNLALSPRTIEFYLANVKAKLGLRTKASLMQRFANGLLARS